MNFDLPERVWRRRRRRGALLGLLLVIGLTQASLPATDNPIVVENQQPGSSAWQWSKMADDTNKQIKGYASATSVNQNENLIFYVTVNPVQNYTIDFFRFGYYGGLGARLRSHVGPLSGVQQPACPTDATTGMIACNWTPGYTLTVPSDWTSGVYGALLTNDQGFQNFVMFVVKDGRPAPFLYQQSISTDQAYNNYPNDGATGKSLYGFNSYGANTVSGTTAAVKVSFDRPQADSGMGNFHRWEMDFIRWLEKSGYDVTYSTSIDTHANGAELLNHKAFLSVGHDEYWTKEMRDGVEYARDSGVSLGFFGANTSYTQIRFESSSGGVPNRVEVEYRDFPWAHTDPVQGPTTTGDYRWLGRPEQTMVGVQFNFSSPQVDYVVTNSSHWVYNGTGFHDGDHVTGIVGYEADSLMSNYPAPTSTNQTLLAQSPYADPGGVTYFHNSSIYQAPSGAWVFASGSITFSWALEDAPGIFRNFKVDPRIQQMTANVLNQFANLVPAVPTVTGFTPASGVVGTSVTINGSNLTGASSVTFNGTAAQFTVTSSSAIQATVPAGAASGPISVTTSGGTASSSSAFTVLSAPTISSFTPTSGLTGASVTMTGTNFTGATAVSFNGTAAAFSVTSDTQIQTTVPAGATTGPVSVTAPGGSVTSASSFTVLVAPTIDSFTPARGGVGTSVTITGTNFTGATDVKFNGTSAAFTVSSGTQVLATAPAGVTSGPLSVTTPGGTATSASNFTAAPTIASFTPTSGGVGAGVTITGTNFTGATDVKFNGTAAAFTVASATSIQATVPAGATTGPLSVTAPGGTATSASTFAMAPTIAGFTPGSGGAGTPVTITGANFSGASAVSFNGTQAAFTVTSDTQVQATAPAGVTSGPLSVTTPGGTAVSAASFIGAPTIAGFTPTVGSVGASVAITGSNFTGATSVAFNGTAAAFTVTSATAIQATVPAGATTGPLSVTAPGGTVTRAGTFSTAPTIASFTPASGPAGTVVNITGTGFTGATSVKFNGLASTNFAVTSPTAIQAIVPTNATTGKVTVTTAGGTATSAANFTVTAVLTVRKTSGPFGLGAGTVTSSPAGVNCGPNCSATFNTITTVTLTPTATFGFFNGWTGCDSVNGNDCIVAIDKAKTVVANFLP